MPEDFLEELIHEFMLDGTVGVCQEMNGNRE